MYLCKSCRLYINNNNNNNIYIIIIKVVRVQVMHGLETSMLQQLKESVDTKNRFGVGFASAEAWDMMQTKVRSSSRLTVLHSLIKKPVKFFINLEIFTSTFLVQFYVHAIKGRED